MIIALLSVAVFIPALQNGFVNWDDPRYVYENQHIRTIDFTFFKWMFTGFHFANWHPLTWLSHAIDYAVWGLDPMGHHLTSILLHGLNTFLVVILITRLIQIAHPGKDEHGFNVPLTAGVVTGLLFALHPIHVESVAWVSERKDLLCAFFFLLSMLSYLKYSSSGQQKKHYILCLLFFILALMSKPMAVTLPVVFIILDLYPLERLSLKTYRRVLIEKLPFFVLSLASSVITVMAQQTEGAISTSETLPLADRVLTAFHALMFYLNKMVWPTGLAPIYPYPSEILLFSPKYMGAFISTVIITIISILLWRRQKVFFAAWAYYIITLLPVLGIIQVGSQAAADRYTYLPSLGPFLLAGLGTAFIYRKFIVNRFRVLFFVPLIILFCVLSLFSVRQTKIWENSVTLWKHDLSLYPDTSFKAYVNLGKAYFDLNDYPNALENLNKAIDINPGNDTAYYNRGAVYLSQDRNNEAIEDFNKAIEVNPRHWEAYFNRGRTYYASGGYEKAIDDFSKVIEINPEFEEVYYNMGTIYASVFNDHIKALKYYSRAIEIKPDYASAYHNRGTVYVSMGDDNNAIDDFSAAIFFNRTDAMAYFNRGHAFKRMGNNALATRDFQMVERLMKQK